MIKKELEKDKAISLRKKGKTYSEILQIVPVAKSTLALWFKDEKLSQPQKQKLSIKKQEAQRRGGEVRRQQRISSTEEIKRVARKEIGKISQRELWLIGTALYWAEGSKEKPGQYSSTVDFCNSDVRMMQLYIRWLLDIVHVAPEDIHFSLYVHKNSQDRILSIKRQWAKAVGISSKDIQYVYYKKHNPKTVRKKIDAESGYIGLLRARVKRGTNLNRKIMGWIEGLCDTI